jgi:hypothetical protein
MQHRFGRFLVAGTTGACRLGGEGSADPYDIPCGLRDAGPGNRASSGNSNGDWRSVAPNSFAMLLYRLSRSSGLGRYFAIAAYDVRASYKQHPLIKGNNP